MIIFKILIVVLGLLNSGPLFAKDDVLTLEEAVAEVLRTNPDVRAARYRADEAKGKALQAIVPPDPMVGVMVEDVPLGTTNPRQAGMTRYQIKQEIPFPGKLYKKGRAAKLDAKAVSEGARGSIADVLLDLKETYYEIYRLDRLLAINRELRGLFKLFLVSAKTEYAAAKTTADVPLKAEVELSKFENEEVLLEQERLAHTSHLKAILNREIHGEIRLPQTLAWPVLDVDLEEVRDRARAARPELGALRAGEERDRARLSAARQGLVPDLSIGAAYDERRGMEDSWTGSVMLNLPIFFWARNRGEIKEAKSAYRAAQAERQSAEVHTVHEIDQAYSAVQSTQRLVVTYEKRLLPEVRTTLESARIAYSAGKVDFMTLLDAARTYKEIQMGYAENQARLGQSFAMLERLVGGEL